MPQSAIKVGRDYPRTIKLEDGSAATFRLMNEHDAAEILAFARNLPEEDLLFLRSDITDPDVVDRWVNDLETGERFTVIAEAKGEMAGYASLNYNNVSWQRHVGEIRIQVGRRFRSQGLGRRLAAEIFAIARELELRIVTAQMTPDQKGAIATFARLGFQEEALLHDFVMDRSGRTRDLLVMAHDVEGFTDRVN